MDLRQKWETIAARHPDEAARTRAREVLAEMGVESQAGPYREGFQDGVPDKLARPATDPVSALMQRREAQEPEEPGMLSRIGSQLGGQLATELKGIGGFFYRPLADTPESQEIADRAEAMGGRLTSAFTLGAGPALTDMAGITSPQRRQAVEQQNPGSAMYGDAVSAMASAVAGPAKLLTEGVNRSVRAVAPRVMDSAIGRIGVSTGTGAGLGGGQEALESGGDLERAKRGALIGAGAGAVGGAIPEAVQLARRGIGAASPWIRRYGTAKDAGMLPEAEALPKGQEGIQRAAEQARDDILSADEALTSTARARYNAAVEPELGRPVNMSPVRRQVLEAGVSSRPVSSGDIEAPTPVVERGRRVLEDLRVDPTVEDALAVRRGLDEDAAFGAMGPTPDQRAARQVRGAVRQSIREASPTVAAADDEFANFRRGQERRNDILFRSEDGGRPVDLSNEALEAMPDGMRQALRVGDEIKATQFLEMMGNDSVEALRRAPYYDELAAQHPAFAEAMDHLMAKKALEATRLNTLSPQVRTNLGKAIGQLPLMGGLLGGSTDLAAQYARGAGRFADQTLRNVQPAANLAPRLSLGLLDALMQRRNQENNQ